ncbi:MAG: hypothetical protein FGM47_00210 [Candidatus Nanopelagicaceae bacterium]|nr:hypothetical protein [Candidatus Nanopelagicaceae bacterium]
MTTFIFMRHAVSTANEAGLLAGRMPGVILSKKGEKQALAIVSKLNSLYIDKILVSPQERCLQSVKPWLGHARKRASVDVAFQEMNYGSWTGGKLNILSKSKDWSRIQKAPSTFTFPNGESFLAAQRRVQRRLNSLSRQFPKSSILIVTHGDIIKLAVASTLNMDLDEFQRIVVDPASITTAVWQGGQKSLISLNVSHRSGAPRKRIGNLSRRRVLGGGSGE